MAPRQTFIIVGGGLAGATAAQTLREEGCAVAPPVSAPNPTLRPILSSVEWSESTMPADAPATSSDITPSARMDTTPRSLISPCPTRMTERCDDI